MENKSSLNALTASDDPVILKGIIQQLFESNQQLLAQLTKIQHQLDQLLKRLYGPRSEKSNLSGPGLFDHLEQPNPETPPTPEPVALPEPVTPPRKTGHGRKKLAAHLPRKRIDHDLTESEKLPLLFCSSHQNRRRNHRTTRIYSGLAFCSRTPSP
jgi:transposase